MFACLILYRPLQVVIFCAMSSLLLKSDRISSKIAYSTPSARGALAAAVAGNSLDELESLTVTTITQHNACYQFLSVSIIRAQLRFWDGFTKQGSIQLLSLVFMVGFRAPKCGISASTHKQEDKMCLLMLFLILRLCLLRYIYGPLDVVYHYL
jgi:hypothetical protein